jgi:hypothetical protein
MTMPSINFGTLLTQFAAMGLWVFIVAAAYAIVEKFLDKHFPDFLAIEPEGASQAPGPIVEDAAKKA